VIQLGLERCLQDPPAPLRGGRFGLLMNQASVDAGLRYACDLLAARWPGRLQAIFSPQHGLWGEQQANMIETGHGEYAPLGVPVYSLYSETRRPTQEMLAGLDCFVIDLQDVGTRIYTFVWTVLECLRACAEVGLPVVLLDRPNPLGGETVEGPLLDPAFRSFVGNAVIPMRHALTLGELARLLNAEESIGCDLHVVPMQGWRRSMYWEDVQRPWVLASPNMQRVETTLVYPGQVLLEGTNLSEGRGTTLPFEVAGAPGLDPWELVREMSRVGHPGMMLRPVRFQPTFDKHRGHSCGGVALHVVEPRAVRSVTTTLVLIDACRRLLGEDFQWLPPPYEYETVKPPIDILFGSDQLRERLKAPRALNESDLQALLAFDVDAWKERTQDCLLYR
jgi:uncharacterized protein YbbC (DUF1343 family)